MIGITTRLFDWYGVLKATSSREGNNDVGITRRVSSTKTLDGGSFVSDSGYSDSDRLFIVYLPDLTKDEVVNVTRLVKLHSKFVLTSQDGAFEVIPKNAAYANGVYKLEFVTVGGA